MRLFGTVRDPGGEREMDGAAGEEQPLSKLRPTTPFLYTFLHYRLQ